MAIPKLESNIMHFNLLTKDRVAANDYENIPNIESSLKDRIRHYLNPLNIIYCKERSLEKFFEKIFGSDLGLTRKNILLHTKLYEKKIYRYFSL